jgi:hypothetical protein
MEHSNSLLILSMIEEFLENISEIYHFNYYIVLLPQLAAWTEYSCKITSRQTESKGGNEEVHSIFSELGATLDGRVQGKKLSREIY